MLQSQFSGLKDAIGLKSALEDTEQRFLGVGINRNVGGGSKSPVAGVSDVKLTLPVLYENGNIFAQPSIKKNGYVPILSEVPQTGSIIQYTDESGTDTYGLVTHNTKTYKEGIFVRAINKDYADSLKSQKPSTQHIKLDSKNILHLFLDVGEFALNAADDRKGNLLGDTKHHDKILDIILMIFISSLILILLGIIFTFL